jgi:hypothetical protein
MKRSSATFLVLAAAVLAAACTNKEGEREAPVFITVAIPLQPGFVDVSTPAPVQIDTINLVSHLKNANATDPLHFADVNLESYRVTFRRTDGGTAVPAPQTFGGGGLLPSGGQTTLNNFPVMYASAIQASPLDQLLPFNGGIDRETGRTEIDTAFDVVFFGRTVSGHRVESQPGSGILIFRFGSAAGAAGSAGR